MQLERIIAVLVLYKSTLSESESFKTLLTAVNGSSSVLTILVYNNSPEHWEYDDKVYPGLEIIYVGDNSNSGVSKAYNEAYKLAIARDKEYILLLDQDTSLSSAFFEVFFKSEKNVQNSESGLFCPQIVNNNELLSPARFFLYTSKKIKLIEPGLHSLKGLAIINSGLIISVELFRQTGGYNEKIKLDFSDFDFISRSMEFSGNIVVLDTKCQHSLSGETEMTLQSALSRFDYYLTGAKYSHRSFLSAAGLNAWVILRAIKLDVRYKSLYFTKKAIHSIIKGK